MEGTRSKKQDSVVMSSWENKVANPDALGEAEKKLWKEIEPLLNELLDELKVNKKIETAYTQVEMDSLGRVLEKLDKFSLAHNQLIDLFKNPDPKPFLNATSKFGFTDTGVVYMYVASAVTLEVLSTELFKVLLLFHMKDVSFAVSRFSSTMESAAPNSWRKLKPYVDSDFRNALSHATYAVENKQIVLLKDAKLTPATDPQARMSLGDFMIRIKTQDVLYQCLVNVLVDKKNAGFFKS